VEQRECLRHGQPRYCDKPVMQEISHWSPSKRCARQTLLGSPMTMPLGGHVLAKQGDWCLLGGTGTSPRYRAPLGGVGAHSDP
jgi:hypothetical protein